MTEKKNVYLSEFIHPEARALLAQHVNIIDDWERIGEADALINRNLVKIDKLVLDKAPRLKVIGIHGTGRDGVDVEEAGKHGVEVFSTPGINAQSVAELNAALALELLRKIYTAAEGIKSGCARENPQAFFRGHEINGKTVGLIGMGNIARKTARIFRDGFAADVLAWSRSLTPEKAEEYGVGYCDSINQVLKQSDIIILALALNRDTEYIIGEEELRLCRKTAVLINTARGRLVREEALYWALTEGQIAAAASDVFVHEPVTNKNPLTGLWNFLPTPHLGANTEEALYRVGMAVVTGVLERLGISWE